MNTKRKPTRGAHDRQNVYAGLARMLGAGMPAAQALESLAGTSRGNLESALKIARRAASSGRPLTTALRTAGLLASDDRSLLENAERAGRIEQALALCATRMQRARERNRKMRTQLILPAAVVFIGLVVAPLPALVSGTLSGSGYLLRSFGPLLAIVALVAALRALLPRADAGWMESLPVFGNLLRHRRVLDTLDALQLHLACGTPAVDALADLSHNAAAGSARRGCITAHAQVKRGAMVAPALVAGDLVDSRSGLPVISAGEQAGRLDQSLGHHLAMLREAQSMREDLVAQWLPRLVYLVAALFAAWTLLAR